MVQCITNVGSDENKAGQLDQYEKNKQLCGL